MTYMLYCVYVMRKWIVIFLIFSFLSSIFDIVDVSDIRLGERELFSTTNDHADNDEDDLSDIQYTSVTAFVLPAQNYASLDFKVEDIPIRHKISNENLTYNFYPGSESRPPIA